MDLSGRKILIGITGGIAAYKIPSLVRLLVKAGAEVQVIMTRAATKFVTPLTLETVSTRRVFIEMFDEHDLVATRHIDLAEWPDLVVIAPATANFLGKLIAGISDDLLTTLVCASPRPIMIAPAMNPQMWSNAITQRNVAEAARLGYLMIEPTEGEMACEHVGVGRMPEPEALFERIGQYFATPSKKKSSPVRKSS